MIVMSPKRPDGSTLPLTMASSELFEGRNSGINDRKKQGLLLKSRRKRRVSFSIFHFFFRREDVIDVMTLVFSFPSMSTSCWTLTPAKRFDAKTRAS
jgi:hypothetical protein